MSFEDHHHLLWDEKSWSSRPESRHLRETPSLIPLIPRELHNEIHKATPPVPLLGYHALLAVNRHFQPSGETLPDIDEFCRSIESASQHRRMHPIERELGELTIETMRLQAYILKGEI